MNDVSNFDQISTLVDAFHSNIGQLFQGDKKLFEDFRSLATTQETDVIIGLGIPRSLGVDAGTLAEEDLFHTIDLLAGAESYTMTAERIGQLDSIKSSIPKVQLTESAKEIVSNRAPHFARLLL